MTLPRRRIVLELKLGADSIDELALALECFAQVIGTEWREDAIPPNGCSGGSSSGFSYTTSFDPAMTHDRYVQELRALCFKGIKPGASE